MIALLLVSVGGPQASTSQCQTRNRDAVLHPASITGRLLPGPLRDRLPALRSDVLAVLGPRDAAWRRQFNVGSLADQGIWLLSHRDVATDPVEAGRAAVHHCA